jgi:lipopolysaccharide/colanic/teichoic acid biosynthesis glycosyltransferase
MYKFRSMTDERDENGKLLPDEVRLTPFGAKLRSTSLDELPEMFNILKGDMSIVGPRPQLVRDIVFMTEEQRHRADVRPGLTGLAQINGRNAISWKKKLEYDLEYIRNESFLYDLKIFFGTFAAVFRHDDINMEGEATALDMGDWLLKEGKVTEEEYLKKQEEAKELIRRSGL